VGSCVGLSPAGLFGSGGSAVVLWPLVFSHCFLTVGRVRWFWEGSKEEVKDFKEQSK